MLVQTLGVHINPRGVGTNTWEFIKSGEVLAGTNSETIDVDREVTEERVPKRQRSSEKLVQKKIGLIEKFMKFLESSNNEENTDDDDYIFGKMVAY